MTSGSVDTLAIETPLGPKSADPPVWDRLWRHHPPAAKDNALLERERRSPRWATIIGHLQTTFGTVSGLRTIELGSGRGDLSALLARRGAHVTLLDASGKGLAQAEQRFVRLGLKARYEHADMLEALEPRQGGFDVALSSGVIEHFKGSDRTRAVEAHLNVLRPGGLAIISVPHALCAQYRLWKFYLELRGWWPYGMEIPYTRRELVRRARGIGFARVETHCTGFWQSVGDHWGRSLLGRGPDWVDKPSRLDNVMGMTLLMFAWRGDRTSVPPRTGGRKGEKGKPRDRRSTRLPSRRLAGATGNATARPLVEKQFLHRGYGVESEMEAEWVRQHLPPGTGPVADIGCGIGALFPMIGARRVIGVDHYAEGLSHTRERFPAVRLNCADAARLPFADRSLDGITAQHVVEHIIAYERACREWFRAMKPGGMLLVLTPNRRFVDPGVFEDETHVHIFDQVGLRRVLQRTGFRVVDLRTLGLPWFRKYHDIPAGWRLRRFVTGYANNLSDFPTWRWKGQTLCCAARRPLR